MNKSVDFTKLPKWAQAEIASRDRKIGERDREIEALRGIINKEPTAALAPDYVPQAATLDPHRHNIPVGDGHIRYWFNEKDYLYIDTRYDEREECLDVHGSRALLIRPSASNSVKVFMERR